MARARNIDIESSDDEFPDLHTLASQTSAKPALKPQRSQPENEATSPTKASAKTPAKTPLRRRKLGQLAGNATLLQPLGNGRKPPSSIGASTLLAESEKEIRPRVRLRARKQRPVVESETSQDEDEDPSSKEDASFVQEASLEDSSEFHDTATFDSGTDDEDTFDNVLAMSPTKGKTLIEKPRRSPEKARQPVFTGLEGKKSKPNLDDCKPTEHNNGDERNKAKGKRSEGKGKVPHSAPKKMPKVDSDLPAALSDLRL